MKHYQSAEVCLKFSVSIPTAQT